MATIVIDKNVIEHFLNRAVENVYPDKKTGKLQEALLSGKRLRVYTGIDPTGASLHLGHVIWMRKLAELQKMGHEVILLIGDFTAMIGDPTDKLATRKQLTREQVLENCKEYKKQASKFLDFEGPNPVQLKFNNDWLGKMSFADVVELASHFTVQQMAEREMFHKRLSFAVACPSCDTENVVAGAEKMNLEGVNVYMSEAFGFNKITCKKCHKLFIFTPPQVIPPRPVYLHEFLYPLMQGYDSVALDVDLEIGGNDQTFNMLAGRTLLREMKNKEKFVLTTKLLTDPTGKKMGKSEGNMISLIDTPEDMYGKVMSWTDGMILSGFELCTDVDLQAIEDMKEKMAAGENPMTFKRRLAEEVVRTLVDDEAAKKAAEHFSQVHQAGEMPEEIEEVRVKEPTLNIVDALVESKLVPSKSEARRQIEQKAIKVDGALIEDVGANVSIPAVIQKGKRHFARLIAS